MNFNTEIIKKNLIEIKEDVQNYSPSPEKVKIVAATKYASIEDLKEIKEAGLEIFGENRVQVLKEKYEYLLGNEGFESVKWHLIGQLQKNKIKYIINYIDMIHSVGSLSLAEEIDKQAKKVGRKIDVLIQVNISKEESKSGFTKEELIENILEIKKYENLSIKGLMTMAPLTKDEELIRDVFKNLRILKEELNEKYFNGSLSELSMGMSNDYKLALLEGASIIRIGSRLFV